MNEEIIDNRIFELRKQEGLTQEELAGKIGVTRQTVIAIEKGRYTPSVLLALKFAQCFSVSVEDIFVIKKT